MAKLGRVYERNRKANKDNNPLAAAKGFSASPDDIYVIPGFNVRSLDNDHVEAMRKAYEDGQYLPPILVAVGENGRLELVDGHHRLAAAKLANVKRLQLSEFEGSPVERISMAVRSSQGRSLSATERARAYQRLRSHGWSDKEIADSVGRSEGDVANHLLLADCGSEVLQMLDDKVVKPTPVIALARQHGAENVARALKEAVQKKDIEAIKEQGAEKIKAIRRGKKPSSTSTAKRNTGTKLKAEDILAPASFSQEDAMKVIDLVSYLEPVSDIEELIALFKDTDNMWQSITMRMPLGKVILLYQLMANYNPKIPYDRREASGEPIDNE